MRFFVKNTNNSETDETESDMNKQLKKSFPKAYNAGSSLITPDELITAERQLLEHAMFLTSTALEKGHLDSLLPIRDGVIIATQGRLGEQKMSELFGVSSLPILIPTLLTCICWMHTVVNMAWYIEE